MSVVSISVASLLVSFAHSFGTTTITTAAAAVDDGGTSEATCKAVCRLTAVSDESAVACKAFARALPYPKMGRMCTRKFREGHDFACSELCYRSANGDSDDHIRPWSERLTHSACQDVSGHIPYPAVFNACKRGYSHGLTSASATLSKRLELLVLGERLDDDGEGEEETISDDGKLSTDEEHRTAQPQSQHREDVAPPQGDAAAANIVESKPPLQRKESVTTVVPHENRQAWTEALGTALEYVDYATVAQRRVSDARRRRGSDLQRGPACPVCGG